MRGCPRCTARAGRHRGGHRSRRPSGVRSRRANEIAAVPGCPSRGRRTSSRRSAATSPGLAARRAEDAGGVAVQDRERRALARVRSPQRPLRDHHSGETAGSSIMPGRCPTQCEAATMLAAQVLGNDVAMNMAAHRPLRAQRVQARHHLEHAAGRACSPTSPNFDHYCASASSPTSAHQGEPATRPDARHRPQPAHRLR